MTTASSSSSWKSAIAERSIVDDWGYGDSNPKGATTGSIHRMFGRERSNELRRLLLGYVQIARGRPFHATRSTALRPKIPDSAGLAQVRRPTRRSQHGELSAFPRWRI